jgi:hypothetical protein
MMTVPEKKSTQLANNWLAGNVALFEACQDDPDNVWLAILELIGQDLKDKQMAVLAAGPLEQLVAWHGATFIDRIEKEAFQNPKFRRLLSGVWRQSGIPQEIWDRVSCARGTAW